MEKMVKVTVFCQAYNHEKYVQKCLEGFVMQKTTFPFEVIMHDDASTDGTADIIRQYAEKYPDIIKPIYQKENNIWVNNNNLQVLYNNGLDLKVVGVLKVREGATATSGYVGYTHELTEYVSARLKEILKNAKNKINYLTKKEISYIIITGGLTEIKDFNIIAEEIFGKNVTIGTVNIIGARDNKYSTSIGMIKNFNKKLNEKETPIVFILWGNFAKSKKELITNKNQFVLATTNADCILFLMFTLTIFCYYMTFYNKKIKSKEEYYIP